MLAADSNRNLLFGVLALQMDFISREQLVAATSVWLLDKSKPIEAILTQQNALSGQDRELLAPLVARHIENHEGDAEKSLAALSSVGSLRNDLAGLGDAEIDATLCKVATASQTDDFQHVAALDSARSCAAVARFSFCSAIPRASRSRSFSSLNWAFFWLTTMANSAGTIFRAVPY